MTRSMNLAAVLGLWLLAMMLPGCQSAQAMSEPTPFGNTERIEDVLARTATNTEGLRDKVDDVLKELAAVREELTVVANQQCDLAQSIQDLKPAVSTAGPRPRAAGENPDVPLIDWSQVTNSVTDQTTVLIDGVRTNLAEYIAEWIDRSLSRIRFEGDRVGLVQHLAEHRITGIDAAVPFETLEELHEARVEQEFDEGQRPDPRAKQAAVPVLQTPVASRPVVSTPSNACPDGQCHQFQSTYSRTITYPLSRAAQRRAMRQAR